MSIWGTAIWASGAGGGGGGFIDGEVNTFADLPLASSNIGKWYLVKNATGLYVINRKDAGLYYSDGLNWTNSPDVPPYFNTSNTKFYDNADNTKKIAFNLTSISTSTTRTYIFPDSNGIIALTSDIDTSSLHYDPAISGLYSGGSLTLNGSTQVDVAAGTGQIVNFYSNYTSPTYTPISWSGSTITVPNLGTDIKTFIYIDNTGTIQTQNTVPSTAQIRTNVYLGFTINNNSLSQIDSVIEAPQVVGLTSYVVEDLFGLVGLTSRGGTVSQTGDTVTNGAMATQITAHTLFFPGVNWHNSKTSPNEITFGAQDPVSFDYILQDGTIDSLSQTLIDPTYYDNGGVKTLVPTAGSGRRTTIQYMYQIVNGNYVVLYGQNVYDDIGVAIASLDDDAKDLVVPDYVAEFGVPLAAIIVAQAATDLEDPTEALITQIESNSLSGGAGNTSLQSAYNVSFQPQILTDSTKGSVQIKEGTGVSSTSIQEYLDNSDNIVLKITGDRPEFQSTKIAQYNSHPTFTNDIDIIDKKYVDDTVSGYVASGDWLQNGFENRTDSSLTWTNTTPDRTLSIQPTATNFSYFVEGVKYTSTGDTVQITDVEGIHIIYYDNSTLTALANPTDDQIDSIIRTKALVSIVYWDTSATTAIYVGEERHGASMSPVTHAYLHFLEGLRYNSGLGLNSLSVGQSGDLDSHAQFGIDVGAVSDEDIYKAISAITSTTGLPIYYLTGASGDSNKVINSGFSVLTTGTGRLAWNEWTGATWQLTEVTNNDFVLCHVFATTEKDNPMIAVIGQAEYSTAGDARTGALTEIINLITQASLSPEFRPIASVIFQTSNGYANAVQARVISTDTGDDYVDWRSEAVSRVALSTSDHSSLSGLSNDDHLQYLNINGRSGGQTTYGGLDANDDLILLSTANASKGGVYVNDVEFGIRDDGDTTKIIMFDASGITTGNSRNIIMPDENVNLGQVSLNTTHRTSNGSDHTYINQDVTTTGTPTFGSVTITNDLTVDTSTLKVNSSTNRVGIGTASPENSLHVVFSSAAEQPKAERTVTFTNALANSMLYKATTSNDMVDGFGAALFIAIEDNAEVENNIGAFGAVRSGADNSGKIQFAPYAIGSPQIYFELDNNGDLYLAGLNGASPSGLAALYINTANGKVTYDSSSNKYKENIKDIKITDAEKLYNLRVVTADRKDGSVLNENCMIAEEMESILPSLVFKKASNWKEIIRLKSRNQYLEENNIIPDPTYETEGINYSGLFPLIVKLLQDHNTRLLDLETPASPKPPNK